MRILIHNTLERTIHERFLTGVEERISQRLDHFRPADRGWALDVFLKEENPRISRGPHLFRCSIVLSRSDGADLAVRKQGETPAKALEVALNALESQIGRQEQLTSYRPKLRRQGDQTA